MSMMTFNAVFGVNPGYSHSNGVGADIAEHLVAVAWQEAMVRERATSNIFVTAVMSPVKVVYPTEFGCPTGGEVAVEASGVCNPKYGVATYDWKKAVIRVVEDVKAVLKQERVTLYFQFTESFHYLESKQT